jgi:hypothetical protein
MIIEVMNCREWLPVKFTAERNFKALASSSGDPYVLDGSSE